MFVKTRKETIELKILRSLNARMQLPKKDENYYSYMEKGFAGEQRFDNWLETLTNDCLILNDLLIEINNTVIQIDTLIITADTLYLFEVKNYEGDYFIESERWFTLAKTEIKNPLLQLKRSESLFQRLLQDLGFTSSVESSLVFVNRDFYLYQAPLNVPILFSHQIERFLGRLNMRSSKLKEKHSRLADHLLSLHLEESPYSRVPEYSFGELEKGIMCGECLSLVTVIDDKDLICSSCDFVEDVDSAVLSSVEEFTMLFPDEKITTNLIHEWCNVPVSKKAIRRVLQTKYKLVGHGKSAGYVRAITVDE
ncbi:nuclease-related domain-containing protein [Alkalihalobacterium elongatum]|uniref:nuclease-related domain-containing protein n=1 Tax=Alkalihalobacterium elongatum TaxID=2675466 RepID=UPI001C1F8FCF|nr:nuclease-related domain-containing protein [Alkalihalobacterium elongatum]